MTPTQLVLLGVILLAAVLLLFLVLLFMRHRNKKLGIDGKRKISGMLHRFASIRSFQVLDDLSLQNGNKEAILDHVLIGFFGIMIVTTKNLSGAVYGDSRTKSWTNVITKKQKEKRNSFPNPLMQNQQNIDLMREILSKNNLYKINIESYVVFTDKKATLFLPKGLSVLKLKQFKKLLKHSKYSGDGDVDVSKVAGVLSGAGIAAERK